VPFKADSLDDSVGHLFDADFLVFTNYITELERLWKAKKAICTGEDDGLDIVIVAQHPNEEFGEVVGKDELAEGLASSANDERGPVFCA
jgi:hypothetical protein